MTLRYLVPDWPAPPGLRAVSTLRGSGASAGPYASFNLGLHVGDEKMRVIENRHRLIEELGLPSSPQWLTQVHGNRVIEAGLMAGAPEADATFTSAAGRVCAVMTAECLPSLLCSRDGGAVAAVHAGWKGLAGGVVESAVAALGTRELLAWLGPAIGPDAFEVGEAVRSLFTALDSAFTGAFRPAGEDKWLADIYQLGRVILTRAGLQPDAIHGGGWCTHDQPDDFFSYRRDRVTGRMATLIWRE
jgi:YfiH family protein